MLMRLRPFGAGRKRQRQPARYDTQYVVKSEVIVTSVAERRERTQPPTRRTKIFHPEPVAYPHYHRPDSTLPDKPAPDKNDAGTDPNLESAVSPATRSDYAVEPASRMSLPVADHAEQPSPGGSDVASPTPSTLAKLIQAKSTQSDVLTSLQATPASSHTAGSSACGAPIATFPRRRGRRVDEKSVTPAVRHRRRR
jgi:hypothetical protein